MSAYVEAVAAYLVSEGLAGGTTGWTIHNLQSQDRPDQEVTIFPTGGPEPEEASDRTWWRPTFQIMTRSAESDPKAGSDKAVEILETLNMADVPEFDVFRATQSTPMSIGPDPQGRLRFVINFRTDGS